MELLKKIFTDDERVVGLCSFKSSFVSGKNDFGVNKLTRSAVYSERVRRNPNIFAFAN